MRLVPPGVRLADLATDEVALASVLPTLSLLLLKIFFEDPTNLIGDVLSAATGVGLMLALGSNSGSLSLSDSRGARGCLCRNLGQFASIFFIFSLATRLASETACLIFFERTCFFFSDINFTYGRISLSWFFTYPEELPPNILQTSPQLLGTLVALVALDTCWPPDIVFTCFCLCPNDISNSVRMLRFREFPLKGYSMYGLLACYSDLVFSACRNGELFISFSIGSWFVVVTTTS